jgi:hypothetical protein
MILRTPPVPALPSRVIVGGLKPPTEFIMAFRGADVGRQRASAG